MNQAPEPVSAGNGSYFDPQQAAALLDRTTLRARRQFEPWPPWLLVVRGLGALVVFGGIWLSVRGQHPYAYPTAWAIPGGVAFGTANTVATVAVAKRAMAGVSGRTKLRRADIAIVTVILIAVIVVMGVLAHNGVSDRIVYGLYPAAAPLIAGGLAWAGIMTARANRREFGTAVAVAVVGAVGLLAGPAGAWGVDAVGVCAVLLGNAAIGARRQRS
ncbi:MAG TPA: hypothetical protein VME44_25470 [Streptosporangiaceae bacterium]|nr:hypothetical protein [Streptosporangiaceae bacterium]